MNLLEVALLKHGKKIIQSRTVITEHIINPWNKQQQGERLEWNWWKKKKGKQSLKVWVETEDAKYGVNLNYIVEQLRDRVTRIW